MDGVVQVKKKLKRVHQNKKVFEEEDSVGILQWGVMNSIRDLGEVRRAVFQLPENFKGSRRVKVSNVGLGMHNLPSEYSVKEYAPLVFRSLRERFGVSDEDYGCWMGMAQDCAEGLFDSKRVLRCGGLVVLQLEPEWFLALMQHLRDYYEYVVERDHRVLLPLLLALFRVTTHLKSYFLLLRETAPPSARPAQRLHVSQTSGIRELFTSDLKFIHQHNIPHPAISLAIDRPSPHGIPDVDNTHSYFLTLMCFVPLKKTDSDDLAAQFDRLIL